METTLPTVSHVVTEMQKNQVIRALAQAVEKGITLVGEQPATRAVAEENAKEAPEELLQMGFRDDIVDLCEVKPLLKQFGGAISHNLAKQSGLFANDADSGVENPKLLSLIPIRMCMEFADIELTKQEEDSILSGITNNRDAALGMVLYYFCSKNFSGAKAQHFTFLELALLSALMFPHTSAPLLIVVISVYFEEGQNTKMVLTEACNSLLMKLKIENGENIEAINELTKILNDQGLVQFLCCFIEFDFKSQFDLHFLPLLQVNIDDFDNTSASFETKVIVLDYLFAATVVSEIPTKDNLTAQLEMFLFRKNDDAEKREMEEEEENESMMDDDDDDNEDVKMNEDDDDTPSLDGSDSFDVVGEMVGNYYDVKEVLPEYTLERKSYRVSMYGYINTPYNKVVVRPGTNTTQLFVMTLGTTYPAAFDIQTGKFEDILSLLKNTFDQEFTPENQTWMAPKCLQSVYEEERLTFDPDNVKLNFDTINLKSTNDNDNVTADFVTTFEKLSLLNQQKFKDESAAKADLNPKCKAIATMLEKRNDNAQPMEIEGENSVTLSCVGNDVDFGQVKLQNVPGNLLFNLMNNSNLVQDIMEEKITPFGNQYSNPDQADMANVILNIAKHGKPQYEDEFDVTSPRLRAGINQLAGESDKDVVFYANTMNDPNGECKFDVKAADGIRKTVYLQSLERTNKAGHKLMKRTNLEFDGHGQVFNVDSTKLGNVQTTFVALGPILVWNFSSKNVINLKTNQNGLIKSGHRFFKVVNIDGSEN